MGIMGAAISSVLARIAILISLVWWTEGNLKIKLDFGSFKIPIAGSAVMLAVLYSIKPIIMASQTIPSLLLFVGIGAAVYLSVSQLLGFDFINFVRRTAEILIKK